MSDVSPPSILASIDAVTREANSLLAKNASLAVRVSSVSDQLTGLQAAYDNISTQLLTARARINELEALVVQLRPPAPPVPPPAPPVVAPQHLAELGYFIGNGQERPRRLGLVESHFGAQGAWLSGTTDQDIARFGGSAWGWFHPKGPVGAAGLHKGRKLMVGIPLGFGATKGQLSRNPDVIRRSFRAVLAGAYDVAYRNAFSNLRLSEATDVTLRIGWECNMNWPGWSMKADEELFCDAWEYVRTLAAEYAPPTMRLRFAVCGGWKDYSDGVWPERVALLADIWSLDWYLRPGRVADLPTMTRAVSAFADAAGRARKSVVYSEVGIGEDVPQAGQGLVVDEPTFADAVVGAMRHPSVEALCIYTPSPAEYDWIRKPLTTARLRELLRG